LRQKNAKIIAKTPGSKKYPSRPFRNTL